MMVASMLGGGGSTREDLVVGDTVLSNDASFGLTTLDV